MNPEDETDFLQRFDGDVTNAELTYRPQSRVRSDDVRTAYHADSHRHSRAEHCSSQIPAQLVDTRYHNTGEVSNHHLGHLGYSTLSEAGDPFPYAQNNYGPFTSADEEYWTQSIKDFEDGQAMGERKRSGVDQHTVPDYNDTMSPHLDASYSPNWSGSALDVPSFHTSDHSDPQKQRETPVQYDGMLTPGAIPTIDIDQGLSPWSYNYNAPMTSPQQDYQNTEAWNQTSDSNLNLEDSEDRTPLFWADVHQPDRVQNHFTNNHDFLLPGADYRSDGSLISLSDEAPTDVSDSKGKNDDDYSQMPADEVSNQTKMTLVDLHAEWRKLNKDRIRWTRHKEELMDLRASRCEATGPNPDSRKSLTNAVWYANRNIERLKKEIEDFKTNGTIPEKKRRPRGKPSTGLSERLSENLQKHKVELEQKKSTLTLLFSFRGITESVDHRIGHTARKKREISKDPSPDVIRHRINAVKALISRCDEEIAEIS